MYSLNHFYLASAWGKTETVDFLIKQGAKIEEKDNYGQTALHFGNMCIKNSN
jgi:ankyrin repeat protein